MADLASNKNLKDAFFDIDDSNAPKEITEAQHAAMEMAQRIGHKLAQEHPEIADIYRGSLRKKNSEILRYIDLAREYLSMERFINPVTARQAVGYAIRELLSDDEIREIRRFRRTKQLENMFGGFDSEVFRNHCRRAAAIRVQNGDLHNIDIDKLTKARGFVPWSGEERKYAIYCLDRGLSYNQIVSELNARFHQGKEIRNPKSLYDMARYDSKRKK